VEPNTNVVSKYQKIVLMSYPNSHSSNVQISEEYVTWYMDMYVLKSASEVV